MHETKTTARPFRTEGAVTCPQQLQWRPGTEQRLRFPQLTMTEAKSKAAAAMSKLEMLTPQNSAIALIDYKPAMNQGVQSHDRLGIFNNVQVLAKAAKLFKIPTVLTTVAKDTFSGEFMPEVAALFPNHDIIDRTSMNSWLSEGFRKAVAATGRKKFVICGLWTEACVTFPTLDMLRGGYEI